MRYIYGNHDDKDSYASNISLISIQDYDEKKIQTERETNGCSLWVSSYKEDTIVVYLPLSYVSILVE